MTDAHGVLMDDVYRHQRLIYDVTRKYYLLGRDHLIERIDAAPDATILEIACGTGRNLARIGRRYPGRRLYGLDISEQMLISARAKLGTRATLARADACAFDPENTFAVGQFDHIVISYALSMIPDWQMALLEAARHLAPGGQLHIVDFGDQSELPAWFKRLLRDWLARFHVTPRDGLASAIAEVPQVTVAYTPLYRGYAQYAKISRSG